LTHLDHETTKVNCERMKVAGYETRTRNSTSAGYALEAKTRQHKLEPPFKGHVPGSETQNPTVAGAQLSGVGH
jgi:ribosomal protein L37E